MGGFKLEQSKHVKQKNYKYTAETWGIVSKNIEDVGQRTFAENLNEAFENWDLMTGNEEQFKATLNTHKESLAKSTALAEQELNQQKEAEIEELRIKAKQKNWDQNKLKGKIADVEKKYRKLRTKKLRQVEKQEDEILARNQEPLTKALSDKVDAIDALTKKQSTAKVEQQLSKQFADSYKTQSRNKKNEIFSLMLYTTNFGYKFINGALRSGEHKTETKESTIIKDGKKEKIQNKYSSKKEMENMLRASERSTLKNDTVLFRNSDLTGLKFFLGLGDEKIENSDDLFRVLKDNTSVNGSVGYDKAFLSTTINKGGTTSFKNMQVEYRILAPQGTKGTYLKSISKYPEENEFLLQSGTMFRVLKVGTEGTYDPANDPNVENGLLLPTDKKIIVYMESIQKNAVKKSA